MNPRRDTRAVLAFVVAALGLAAVAAQDGPRTPPPTAGEALARQVCTSCHAFPPPDILPRNKWSAKVFEMVGLAVTGTGAPKGKEIPLDVPVEEILAFFESAAPRELSPPAAWPEPSNSPVAFARHSMTFSGGLNPIVANVRLLRLKSEGQLQVIAADMSNGLILRGSPTRPEAGLELIARVPNPATPRPWTSTRTGSWTSWWPTSAV